MMDADRILQYCIFVDYPLFRRHIAKYRDKFKKVILYPSRQHGVLDLEAFSREVFPETWVEPVKIEYGVEDWRQAETDPCIVQSDAEWLWFTEQDFFVRDWDKFYADVEKAMPTSDAIGWWSATAFPYLHPSCFLIRRSIFEKTQKDFRAHPEIFGSDHYAMLTKNLLDMGARITTLQSLGYEQWKDAFHLGGLTYVYQDWKNDGTDIFGVTSPEAFFAYNHYMRETIDVKQDPRFMDISYEVEEAMIKKFGFNDSNIEKWKEFFK